jgi:hypothetical protein
MASTAVDSRTNTMAIKITINHVILSRIFREIRLLWSLFLRRLRAVDTLVILPSPFKDHLVYPRYADCLLGRTALAHETAKDSPRCGARKCTTYGRDSAARAEANVIHFPSGDHEGIPSLPELCVRLIWPLPSTFIT